MGKHSEQTGVDVHKYVEQMQNGWAAKVATYEAHWSRQLPCIALAICLYHTSLLVVAYDTYNAWSSGGCKQGDVPICMPLPHDTMPLVTVAVAVSRQTRQDTQTEAAMWLRTMHSRVTCPTVHLQARHTTARVVVARLHSR